MRIQPSAIALIAKGIALIGDGKVNDGYRACDFAIAQSPTPNDAHFLHVIKVPASHFYTFVETQPLRNQSIIFCMVENTEDAISPVNDLINTLDDRPMYYFVQACTLQYVIEIFLTL